MIKMNKLIFTCLVIVFIYYSPYFPPFAEVDYIEAVKGGPLVGPLYPNNILDNAEKLHENVLFGPESIAYRSHDEIFVGVEGGDIVKIYGENFQKTKTIANNGPGCAGFWEESICGRPLGMRFHSDGLLYVADAYLGAFSVNVNTGKSNHIFDLSEPINGTIPRLADDLDFDKEGNIYWSDATTVASLDSSALEIFTNPSGRLIKYNIKTKKQEVILDKLHFANGVQFSPKKDFVLVNDLHRKRTLRYWVEGEKAFTSDIFVQNLPGMPDNIRPRLEGGYYISIIGVDEDHHHDLFTFFGSRPTLKRFALRITAILSMIAQSIEYIIPNIYCKTFIYQAFSLHSLTSWAENKKAIVVEVDENGKVIGSLQGNTGKIKRITEAQRVGDNIFFGSAFNNYLGRINIRDVHANRVSQVQNSEKYKKDEL